MKVETTYIILESNKSGDRLETFKTKHGIQIRIPNQKKNQSSDISNPLERSGRYVHVYKVIALSLNTILIYVIILIKFTF